MQTTLATTALLMGVVGGPHCIAMCGAACAGIGQAAGARSTSAMWTFQLGRVLGYSGLGALAAASMQGLGWLTVQSSALRPVWSMFHVAMIVLGLLLMWKAQQPIWMEQAGRELWCKVRGLVSHKGASAPLLIGAVWTFLPCGLLYSALLVAALAGGPMEGALVMALFAMGTSVSMMLGPWLWLRLRGNHNGDWGVRLAGLALALSSGWALWMALAHDTAPWCTTP
ncbi:sulfite exporter TauE/SafE family protein [Rhodoferax sp.]|uniref:sulfite exporter TauE/SafE family protein n=1 Tax=Rhodoferax sp. TaxID=50421 RepID=UPI00262057BB|nr:sulfite exporter TauE/SafE family protein [Rhodoferax sp.]MDD2917958.1 sulfite exporter TauE/SafE family protein [Rhodoferax sp.]